MPADPELNTADDGVISYVPPAVGAVEEDVYDVELIPAYVKDTEPTESLPTRVECEKVGLTAAPWAIDKEFAAIANGSALIVAVTSGCANTYFAACVPVSVTPATVMVFPAPAPAVA